MIDPAKLAAFALVSGATSLVPGPSMLFVMSQSVWRGARSGGAALAGVQFGYIVWWLLAALGLGTLAAAFPLAFRILAVGGALYLAWLGAQALRHAGSDAAAGAPGRRLTAHPVRDGIIVAIGNPKALVYIVTLLPPFVDPHARIGPQLVILALVALVIDVAFGALYIAAGAKLSGAIATPRTRRRLDLALGAIFLVIGSGILAELFWP